MNDDVKIPYDVWAAVNDHPKGFDALYFMNLIRCKGKKQRAFYKTIDRINQYFPKYAKYSSYNSYHIARNKRMQNKDNRV